MFRLSNNLIGILNFITFLLSVPIIWAGVWLRHHGSSECDRFLDTPLIVLGVFLMLVSIAGLVGACCKNSCLLWIYLVVMFLLIVLLFCFTIFAFVVTNQGAGKVLSNRGYKEYELGDYSNWLRKRVTSEKNWGKIRSCLIEAKVCSKFNQSYLSCMIMQSGCCKPPSECGFTYINPTNWTKGVVGNDSSSTRNQDCAVWNSDPSVLCYDCDSCKAAFLDTIKTLLRKSIIVGFVLIGFLILVYIVGYLAFRDQIWEGLDSDAGSGDDR
ncbi:TET7 [Linum grandiflorum]